MRSSWPTRPHGVEVSEQEHLRFAGAELGAKVVAGAGSRDRRDTAAEARSCGAPARRRID